MVEVNCFGVPPEKYKLMPDKRITRVEEPF